MWSNVRNYFQKQAKHHKFSSDCMERDVGAALKANNVKIHVMKQSYKTGRTPLFHEYMKVAKLANDSLDKPFLTIDNCRRPENRQKCADLCDKMQWTAKDFCYVAVMLITDYKKMVCTVTCHAFYDAFSSLACLRSERKWYLGDRAGIIQL